MGWGTVSHTCLSSQHEGCVPIFVLLVHIQKRTAAEQSHNGTKAMVACDHEACLGTQQLGPPLSTKFSLGPLLPPKSVLPRCCPNPVRMVFTHLKSVDDSGTLWGSRRKQTRMPCVEPRPSSAALVSPGASHPPIPVHLGGLLWGHASIQPGLEPSEVVVDTCPVQCLQIASKGWGLVAGARRCLRHVQSSPGQ